MTSTSFDTTDLTWLTGLARALIRDANAADDLAQETMLVALKHEKPERAPRRAWLAGIARRLAARRFRTDSRRSTRERHAAKPELTADVTDVVERAELAQKVVTSTRALPEPYRTTILLRFMDGLSTAEIAARVGRPTDTVRLRVRKGLEMLRQELERETGCERRQLRAVLMPLAIGADRSTHALTATWLAMKTKIFLAATAAAVSFSVWLWPDEDTATRPESDSTASAVVDPEVSAPELPPAERVAERTRVNVPDAQPRVAAPTPRLAGLVVDEFDEPVSGAKLYVMPESEESEPSILARSDENGRFAIERPESTVTLGAVANGFLRRRIDGVDEASDDLRIVLERGLSLRGRVVDSFGRGVPDLNLLVHTAGKSVSHVSQSKIAIYADRAALGSTRSNYEGSQATTDEFGQIEFTGLPDGQLNVLSLDPSWKLSPPTAAEANGREQVWTATRRFGVRVTVVDPEGQPVPLINASFNAEVTSPDGSKKKHGQWVGQGRGVASFGLDASMLGPGASDIEAVRFFGTVRTDDAEAEWRADRLDDLNFRSMVNVRVVLEPSRSTEADAEPPTATIELDIRYDDGNPVPGGVFVQWTTVTESGDQLRGRARPKPGRAGARLRVEVPAGEVSLKVSERYASGSLPAWTKTLTCAPASEQIEFATLKRGATAVIKRPPEWTGDWTVHASWRTPDLPGWQGSWNYGTSAGELTLNALDAVEWRFQLRQAPPNDGKSQVRIVTLEKGERRVVD